MSTDYQLMSCASFSAFSSSFKLRNPRSHMKIRRGNPQHRDKSCQKRKMVETFRRTKWERTSWGERLVRRDNEKCRVKSAHLKHPFYFDHRYGLLFSIDPSKVRAQKQPKIVAPAPLASDPASLYLMKKMWNNPIYLTLKYRVQVINPEWARDFSLFDFRPNPNQNVLSKLRKSMVQPDFFITGW